MVPFNWLLFLLLTIVNVVSAAPDTFTEGVHYQRLAREVPTTSGDGKIEIVELFWYGCPHCYDFEHYMNDWLESKPSSVEFVRVPASLNPSWTIHARTFYALEAMNELERMHMLLFMAIHEQGRRLRDLKSISRFVAQHGIDETKFIEVYSSSAVQLRLRQASERTKQYGATGVPTVIVNGKYLTSASMAGSYGKVLDVIDYLVEKEYRKPS